MKDKPILFSTPMVQVILDGTKTQTRRVIKNEAFQQWIDVGFSNEYIKDPDNLWLEHSPYQVGQKLWVRETWCYGKVIPVDHPDGFIIEQCDGNNGFLPYEAMIREGIGIEEVKWKPSIFMPKKYARIWLEVTAVMIERVQDITEEDAIKEGIPYAELNNFRPDPLHKAQFIDLWDSFNKKRGYGWDVNPWVWVIEFKLLENGSNI